MTKDEELILAKNVHNQMWKKKTKCSLELWAVWEKVTEGALRQTWDSEVSRQSLVAS